MREDASEIHLTPKEAEVVRLVSEGHSYWEITHMLHLGSGVVRACMDRIYRKLQLRWGDPEPRDFDALLADLELDEAARAVVFGVLGEIERK